MEWLNGHFPDPAIQVSWYMAVPVLLAYVLLPLTAFFFYCRYCLVPFRWMSGVGYTILYAVICAGEAHWQLQGSAGLLAEILLLVGCGRFFLRRRWTEALTMSVLIQSVLSVGNGIAGWVGYRVILPFILEHEVWVYPSDTVRECFRLLLVCALSVLILRHFHESITKTGRETMIQLTLPVFFLSLVVRIIQNLFYGSEFQVDAETGEILASGQVNHAELLLLQFLACICLLVTLSAYGRILRILQTEQKIRLLEQQTAEQEVYLQEALLRDRQTRAFRHDIKNHLTVLAELLKEGQTDRAYAYLSHLDGAAAGLSCPVRTGNGAVDALLRSKYSVAEQHRIRIRCELAVPDRSRMCDTDWCILLSNALDNAIRACQEVEEDDRFIHIFSRKKGNFYLLTVENSCSRELPGVPEDGIGLSNIRTVAGNHDATVENTVADGIYRLQMFFGNLF